MRFFSRFSGLVHRDERLWVGSIAATGFLLSAASVAMYGLLQSMAVIRYGAGGIVAVMAIAAASVLAGAWATVSFMRRRGPTVQSALLIMLAVVAVAMLAAARTDNATQQALGAAAFLLCGTIAYGAFVGVAIDRLKAASNEIFDFEQIQRLDPLFASAQTLGVFVGGILLAVGSRQLSAPWLFATVAVLAAGSLASLLAASQLKEFSAPVFVRADERPAFFWPTFENATERKFLTTLAAIVGLSATFSGLFLYLFGVAVASRFVSEAGINAFVGAYMAALTVTSVVFVTTTVNPILRRRGLTDSLFIPPLVVVLGAIVMMLVPSFWMIIAVVFVRDAVISLQHTAFQAMLEGMADERRSKAWAWIDGPVATAGTIIGAVTAGAVSIWVAPHGIDQAVRAIAFAALFFLIVRFWLTEHIKKVFPGFLVDSLADGDFKGRLRATEALEELRHASGTNLAPLIDVARSEQEPSSLRIVALRTLAVIGDTSVIRGVERLLAHPDHLLRLEAIRTIARFSWPESGAFESGFSRHALIGYLKYGFARENNRETVDAIIEALVALRDPDIVPFMLAAVRHPSVQVRHGALRALRLFHDPAIIDIAKPFLMDNDPGLRAQAVAAVWSFAWERTTASSVFGDLMAGKSGSAERAWGLYLVGRLHLHDFLGEAASALSDISSRTRLAAGIALLKNGDDRGMPVLEKAIATGSTAEADEVERLADHPNVPEQQRERIKAFIHQYHLHYPAGLPVSEPLRVRLHDIPADCLKPLLAFFKVEAHHSGRKKIEGALLSPGPARVKGHVMLLGVQGEWAAMASVCLLANGYLVRIGVASDALMTGERVVCGPKVKSCPVGAIRLVDHVAGNLNDEIPTAHAAPSKLIAKLEGRLTGGMVVFEDREEASRLLSKAILERGIKADIVLALPRGGVIPGRVVADALEVPLDVAAPRRIGSKEDPEITVGAVTESGEVIWDEAYKAKADPKWCEAQVSKEIAESKRRLKIFRVGKQPRNLQGKSVLIVDDGMANGFTMLAAIMSARTGGAARVTIAVPVASNDAVERVQKLADDSIILSVPEFFWAIGTYYHEFDQVEDAEALRLLKG